MHIFSLLFSNVVLFFAVAVAVGFFVIFDSDLRDNRVESTRVFTAIRQKSPIRLKTQFVCRSLSLVPHEWLARKHVCVCANHMFSILAGCFFHLKYANCTRLSLSGCTYVRCCYCGCCSRFPLFTFPTSFYPLGSIRFYIWFSEWATERMNE